MLAFIIRARKVAVTLAATALLASSCNTPTPGNTCMPYDPSNPNNPNACPQQQYTPPPPPSVD